MTWPGGSVDTAGMDSDSDTLPRADILILTQYVNAIIAARAAASGICDLDSGAKIPTSRYNTVPIGQGGTGQTTAGAALSALGGYPVTGGLVSGDGGTSNNRLQVGNNNSGDKYVDLYSSTRRVAVYLQGTAFGAYDFTGSAWRWQTDSSYNFVATGNVSAYSDGRLKDNVEGISNAPWMIDMMRGVRFTWNDKAPEVKRGKSDYGFIAQALLPIIPEAVAAIGDDGYLTVAETKILPVVVEALKIAQTNIRSLQEELDKLHARVMQLEGSAK